MTSLRPLCLLTLSLLGSVATGAEHHYQLAVDPELTTLTITAQLSEPVRSLSSRNSSKARYLLGATSCDGDHLRVEGRRISLPRDVSCVRYRYNLAASANDNAGRHRTRLRPGIVLTSPGDWLFRPRLAEGTTLKISLNLPSGAAASVPWESLGANTYRLGRSPRSAAAIVALGDFDYREVKVAGTTLRVALLHEEVRPMDNDKLMGWLEQAASGVARAYGRFPNPSPQVLLVPSRSRWGSSPVPFGRVVRNGGESVQFFVDPDRRLTEYLKDWTATHEFAHLLLPYVRDRWVSEGFASYYQNVLMARAGHYTEGTAWAKLHAGIERARAVRPRVSPASTSRGSGARMMVYWSGAALALVADVRLRRVSNGAESLDVLLSRLQDCCLPSERSWRAAEFFRQLDELSEYQVFTQVYREFAERPGVPDLTDLYQSLGIRPTSASSVQVTNRAPEFKLRRQLMLGAAEDT